MSTGTRVSNFTESLKNKEATRKHEVAVRKLANEEALKGLAKKISTGTSVSNFTESLKNKGVERNKLTKEEESKPDLDEPLKPMSFEVEQRLDTIISAQDFKKIDSEITETIENFEVNDFILKKIHLETSVKIKLKKIKKI